MKGERYEIDEKKVDCSFAGTYDYFFYADNNRNVYECTCPN